MSDLISRQDAVNEIHKYFVEEIDKTPTKIDEDGDELYTDMPTVNSLLACNKELSKRIKSLPSAEPKTGKWIDSGYGVECSLCGEWYPHASIARNQLNFCPNCGASMRPQFEEPEINPCRGCEDYDGEGGCKTKGGCADRRGESE